MCFHELIPILGIYLFLSEEVEQGQCLDLVKNSLENLYWTCRNRWKQITVGLKNNVPAAQVVKF